MPSTRPCLLGILPPANPSDLYGRARYSPTLLPWAVSVPITLPELILPLLAEVEVIQVRTAPPVYICMATGAPIRVGSM